MNDLSKRLWKYSRDYADGKTLDFDQVFSDCVLAADKLCSHSNNETISVAAEHARRTTKLCEIKVDRKDSLQELVYHLTANGYRVDTAVVWKEYPQSGIDYWMTAIFDRE